MLERVRKELGRKRTKKKERVRKELGRKKD